MVAHNLAQVKLWGHDVGALAYDEKTRLCTFEYEPKWITKGIEVSPLWMPLAKKKYQFSLPFDTYKGLPSVFADTLPDDYGNALINAWLARNGRDISSFTALERLLYTGKRGIGALEYSPAIRERGLNTSSTIELDSLLAVAQQVLDERAGFSENLLDNENEALTALIQIGTSAGGARPKAIIGINKKRTHIRSGQASLPKGFEHYILKFDGLVEHRKSEQTFGDPQGYGRMEYAYYLMAQDAKVDMMPCELFEEGPRAHFMTKRFDRIGNEKIHYLSLCGMDHADYKKPGEYSYEQVFNVMRRLKLKRHEALQMFRRMVFNIVARNQDDHTKNIGFVLKQNQQWALSKAFDIAFSYKKDSKWVNSHQLSLNGKRDHFIYSDLMIVAKTFEKEAGEIVKEVIQIVSQWPKYAKKAGVSAAYSNEIKSLHRLKW
ncbi:MAG: type II toxin-antitoxin system HipA family toxin [Gammaproteobacteria bacterium]|nr:type II toxin-antitoxin system HipA family toxin [Gammaproteobacteria bacterium]